ncbi:MAG: SprT family zinc-dependent metalloprotease [Boseongicola sp.]|nr:SprT family zinc-dependent metalloprotease [Boseongicola sp.]
MTSAGRAGGHAHMGQEYIQDKTGAEVILRRSPRARRMTLRVSTLDGRVTLTVPRRVALPDAQAFVSERSDWIAAAKAKVAPIRQVGIGSVIPIEGVDVEIIARKSGKPALKGGALLAPYRGTAPSVQAFLKAIARERIVDQADACAAQIGTMYRRLSLRDTRSRWGSCSADGNLMLSWRLIMAPPDVLQYVVAHEVAHLREMNHSASFWSVVETLFPDHSAQRKWLRQHGPALHSYRFD